MQTHSSYYKKKQQNETNKTLHPSLIHIIPCLFFPSSPVCVVRKAAARCRLLIWLNGEPTDRDAAAAAAAAASAAASAAAGLSLIWSSRRGSSSPPCQPRHPRETLKSRDPVTGSRGARNEPRVTFWIGQHHHSARISSPRLYLIQCQQQWPHNTLSSFVVRAVRRLQ